MLKAKCFLEDLCDKNQTCHMYPGYKFEFYFSEDFAEQRCLESGRLDAALPQDLETADVEPEAPPRRVMVVKGKNKPPKAKAKVKGAAKVQAGKAVLKRPAASGVVQPEPIVEAGQEPRPAGQLLKRPASQMETWADNSSSAVPAGPGAAPGPDGLPAGCEWGCSKCYKRPPGCSRCRKLADEGRLDFHRLADGRIYRDLAKR